MSYWVRWDSSPNRQTIHEIIDAFEDGLAQSKKDKNRKERRKRGSKGSDELKRSELGSSKDELGESESVEEITIGGEGEGEDCGGSDGDGDGDDDEEEEGFEKGSVRKFLFSAEVCRGVGGDDGHLRLLVLHNLHRSSSLRRVAKHGNLRTLDRRGNEQEIKLSLENEKTEDDGETLAMVEKTYL
ncbi:hypothetical protein LOK49_LG09G01439 [Camellia lanceoleosa]|uniref:Uncharacterized protein n=1 Tax=Camellia lanceoleosa TaxID=1840588 RepID=A0ACC0GJT9_9ERIC|nr:hypothetical protein LOK49_LG09G01439 [Camellia lanceoleosa]